jgi:hypothetical protein
LPAVAVRPSPILRQLEASHFGLESSRWATNSGKARLRMESARQFPRRISAAMRRSPRAIHRTEARGPTGAPSRRLAEFRRAARPEAHARFTTMSSLHACGHTGRERDFFHSRRQHNPRATSRIAPIKIIYFLSVSQTAYTQP